MHRSPDDPRSAAADRALDVFQRGHTGVAGGCHCKRAVGGSPLDSVLGAHAAKECAREASCERVPPTYAIEDLKVTASARLVERAFGPEYGAPVMAGGCAGVSEGARDDLNVGIFGRDLRRHRPVGSWIERGKVFVQSVDREPQCCREVLLVSEQNVYKGDQPTVDLLRGGLSAQCLPKRWTVVEIVGHNDTVRAGGGHRFGRDRGGGL